MVMGLAGADSGFDLIMEAAASVSDMPEAFSAVNSLGCSALICATVLGVMGDLIS